MPPLPHLKQDTENNTVIVEVCCENKNWNNYPFIIYIKYEWIPNSIFERYFLFNEKCYSISDEGLKNVGNVNYIYEGNKVLEHKIFDFINFDLPEFKELKKILNERDQKYKNDSILIQKIVDKNQNISLII